MDKFTQECFRIDFFNKRNDQYLIPPFSFENNNENQN